MKNEFNFCQARIPSGKLSCIFNKPFEVSSVLLNRAFMEALKDSSPEFYGSIHEKELSDSEIKTLYKYFSRWCTRPTPFGKFAGVFTVDLTDKTRFPEFIPRFYSEPDIQKKKELTNNLLQSSLSDAIFYVNTSLTSDSGKYHLLQYIDQKYIQISIDCFDVLDEVIKLAGSGASYTDLKTLLLRFDFTPDEVAPFIQELTDEQLLFTNYEFRQSETIQEYRKRHLNLDINLSLEGNYTFSHFPDAEIDKAVIEDLLSEVKKLKKFFFKIENPRIEAFKNEFLRRFEGRTVPLRQVMDPEHGIAYGTYSLSQTGKIIGTLEMPKKVSSSIEHLQYFPDFLLDKYIQCLATGGEEIHLSESDLHSDKEQDSACCYIFGSLLGDKNRYQFYLKSVGGSSPVNLMSRFSLGNPELAKRLREITKYEQAQSSAILAEVVYAPEGRIGNVVLHAKLRDYHIPFLGYEEGNKITLDDLTVSIVNDEIILNSVKYNRRVIPFLSHAFNYNTALPVCCFLGDLQNHSPQFVFDWGILKNREYLPRVVYGKLILSRATWNLTSQNYKEAKLPHHIVIIEEDNELYLNLGLPICLKILEDYLRKSGKVQVREFIHSPENCFMDDRVSEMVIPVAGNISEYRKETEQSNSVGKYPSIVSSRRTQASSNLYPPGSEWLYFKIYTGSKTIDNLLRDKIKPFVELLTEKKLLEKWFFIRYQDPDTHLRLRFYNGSNSGFYKTVLEMFYTFFREELTNGVIHDLQVATYMPEYTRYPDMEEAEEIFMEDSYLVLNRLESDDENYRIETSLRQMDRFLSGFTLSEKVRFCLVQRDGFLDEFGQELRHELNRAYRSNASLCREVLLSKSHSEIKVKESVCLASYIHMHVNRNFISEARKYEMMLYHFLYRHYDSLLARKDLDLAKNS